MPVTIDITQDLRYQQGENAKSILVAKNLLKEGLAISFVQKITGLSINEIEEIALKLKQS